MKKINLMIALCLCASAIFAQEETTTEVWDIMDRTMGADWEQVQENVAGGSIVWQATVGSALKPKIEEWSVSSLEEEGMTYIKLLKTGTAATNYTAVLNSQGGGVVTAKNTAYTFEYKARINPIDTLVYPLSSGYEMNVLSARLNQQVMDIYLSREKDGREYVAKKFVKDNWGKENPMIADEDKVYVDVDLSQWHLYRFILAEDAKTVDFYIDGKLILEDVATVYNKNGNLLKLGTASERSRVDIDLAYAKMATGALIPQEEIPNPPTLNKELKNSEISVYPTVLSRGAQLNVSAQSDVQIAIFDLNGKQLAAASTNTAIAPMVPGMYIVKVSANGVVVKETKIVVIK